MLIRSGNQSLQVDFQGGSVLSWQYREHFILGPARMENVNGQLKPRGFSHWCFPNFGPPAEQTAWGDLVQHGFLRHFVMVPSYPNYGDPKRLWLKSPDPNRQVEVLSAISPFETRLVVKNVSGRLLPILPGFHPYFAVPPGGFEVRMGRIVLPPIPGRDAIGPTVLERIDPIEIELKGVGTVRMEPSSNCEYVVVWSDKPDSYLCVELVFDGKPGTFGTSESYMLAPGEVSECNVFMSFRPFG